MTVTMYLVSKLELKLKKIVLDKAYEIVINQSGYKSESLFLKNIIVKLYINNNIRVNL